MLQLRFYNNCAGTYVTYVRSSRTAVLGGGGREGGTVTDGQGGFAPKLAPSSSLFARCFWHIVAKKRRDTWHIFAFSQERKEKARKIERGAIFWKGPCVPFLKLDFAKSVNYTLLSRNGTRHYGFRGGKKRHTNTTEGHARSDNKSRVFFATLLLPPPPPSVRQARQFAKIDVGALHVVGLRINK